MAKLPLARTRFGRDIVAEFMPSERGGNRVAIITSGAPGYPGGKGELMQLLSEKGYCAIVPRYRGTWESDGSFLEYPPSDDVITIIDELSVGFRDLWSSAEYRISEPEVYLIGGSFGGPAALLASRDVRVVKAVTISAVVDWRMQEHTLEPLDLMSMYMPQAFGPTYRSQEDAWKKLAQGGFYNPVDEKESLDGKKLLMFHAKDDKVVPFAPAEDFAREVGATFIPLKRGGHMGAGNAKEPYFWKYINRFFSGKRVA